MTDPAGRGAHRLDVAVRPVAGRGRRRAAGRRAIALVGGVLAVVVGGALLGGLTRDADQPLRAVAPSPRSAVATPSRAPASPARPEERLPTLANRPLPDAPTVVFYRRSGDDLERLEWSPAGPPAIERAGTIVGALRGIALDAPYAAIPSPDGARIAIRGLEDFGTSSGDIVRIARTGGRVEWAARGAGLPIAPMWSPDGSRVLLPGEGGSWRVLAFGDGEPVETMLDPGAADAGPRAQAEPLAFSRDGRWLYVAVTDDRRSAYRPVGRYSTATGEVARLDAFPVDGPAAPAPDGRLGYELDPATGRRAVAPSAALAGGPTDVHVFEADGSEAFSVRLDVVAGLAWAGDGRLLALETDVLPGPSRVRLVTIGPDGRLGEPLLDGGRLTWAALAGARDGYALLAFATGRPPAGVLVAVLRLGDGATATLFVPAAQAPELHFGEWR